MNKNIGKKQFILRNRCFNQKDVWITHLVTFFNDKGKVIQKKVQKVLKQRGI